MRAQREGPGLAQVAASNAGMIVETPLALYGLAHAPRKWNDSVVAFLLENGWEQLKSDRCVFALRDKDGALCALAGLHFDDFLLPGLPD